MSKPTEIIHRSRKIKKLDPELHGKNGYRVVSTGKDFKLLRSAKAHIDTITGN